jgi:8-oxo-dGTP pyrophosphatase MutT (NUDIX family)
MHWDQLMTPHDDAVRLFRPAVYGVLIQGQEVLLVRAPPTATMAAGVVGFPGGGIELGEAPIAALRREFAEETGLEVEPLRLLWATTGLHRSRANPQQQLVAIHWEVRCLGGSLKPGGNGADVAQAFFCPLQALPVKDMLGVDLEVVPLLQARFSQRVSQG